MVYEKMKKKDIFISYRNDGIGNNFSARLTSDLEKRGYSVYFNPCENRSVNFPERLKRAIKDCKDFICVVTNEYVHQLQENNHICWIRDELLYAKDCQKNIIPLLVNGVKMPAESSLPDLLKFFSKIDALAFPEQYLVSPFSALCNSFESNSDGKDDYRDVYNSSKRFNPDKALDEILKQAYSGSIHAMLEAGIYYFYGIATEIDTCMAAYWLKQVSESSSEYSAIANKFIARMYYEGTFPREFQSYEKSYEHYQRSASKDSFSAGQLGYMKSIGSGCVYDYKKTEQFFLSSLDTFTSFQKSNLCDFYIEHGEFDKAAEIYETMADYFPEAAFQLGLLYKRGVLSTPFFPDYSQAALYFQLALDNGYTRAAYELGMLYFNPTGKFKKDFKKALKNFAIAADQGGYAKAQYMLGYMYRYGHVKKDISKAIKYFELAAKQGDVLSAANLGLLYQQLEFHNYEKAFYYCKIASDCGDAVSEFVLGTLYLCGRGCEADEDKAYLCFKHAYENGAPESSIMIERMQAYNL